MKDFPVVVWGNTRAAFLPAAALLPNAPITAALVFAILDNRFVLADIAGRGWCIPGGRLEPDESAEQAARRETREEIGATLGPLLLLGHYVLAPAAASPNPIETKEIQGADANVSPSEEAQNKTHAASTPHTDRVEAGIRLVPAYLAPVLSLTNVPPGSESRGVLRVRYEDLPTTYYAWDPLLEAMFAYAWAHHNAAL